MAPPRSAAFLRLHAYIAERMRMRPIDQPLMLLELLGRRSTAPKQDVARRILASAWVGKVLTGNGITAYGNGATSLIGGSVNYRVHRYARGRCECCCAHEHQQALEVAPIIPKAQPSAQR